MAVADLGYIAGHLGLEQDGLTSLAADPNLASLFKAVEAKAHEFDTLYSEKLRVDIELENAVVGSEARCQTFKATADKALKEVEELRQKLKDEESTRQTLQNELQSLRSRSTEYDSEIGTLKDQIESLQASNRTNMALLESRNARDDQLSEELSKQHQKNVQLNKEITTLQQTVQAAQAASNSAKYRAESLQQQLDLARRSGEWFENELKTKTDEALKYRKEKGARIAELQRQNEEAKADIESLRRGEQQLRQRLDAAQSKADEALVKVQQQQEAFARTEESYKKELENQRRLVEMSDQLTRKHQDRVQEMELEKERVRDNYENEIRRVRLDLERERQTVTELEERIQQLEGEVDELQARAQHEPPAPASPSAPQTPRANGSVLGRAFSPFTTPGSIRSKTTITATQALDEVFKLKGQLAGEKRRNQQLSDELDQVLAALEAKAPQINELQSENESLRVELNQMSHLSEQSHEERDVAKRAARKAEGALSTAQTEAKILRTQLRDLSMQIQMLVFNMHAREKGLNELTDEEKYRLEQLSKGEITEDALADMSDTHQFITHKFVVFKDIKELQEKNQELLRVTRELAEQMESEEALAAKHKAAEDHKAVQRLEQDLVNLNEEAQSLKTTMESYKAERDMFRRLLQQKASAGELASVLGSPAEDGQRPPLASIETGADDQEAVSAAALRQLEATFDNYRNEQNMIRQTMREQADRLSNEKTSLQGEVVKLSSQLTLASERYDMLHANFVALQGEQAELQKRNQSLSETTAKQDIRTQQVAEELVETRELLESTRNEAANLKAEKKLWKDIQDRLSKNHETLMEEKERLSSLLASQQSLMNERDIAESEARRKFQARIDSLESELSETKRKLNTEIEEGKKLQLRKEFDSQQSQKRIDELTASLSQVREELVRATTARDHLQARTDELTVNLRNAEERVGRLQPRPTPRPGMPVEPDTTDEEREQELQNLADQVSDLKRDLDLAQAQLDNAKNQADRFRELSQTHEEALADLTASQEQAQQEIDNILGEKDAQIKELEQRVEELSSELANSNNQLSALRDSQGEVTRRFEDEKHILEDEIKRLKDDAERYSESAKFHQQDLRAQAEIATKAQQDYEQELVKHAEAAKLLQALRTEHNLLKSEAASFKAAAESAKVTLSQNEASWEERRQQLEREIQELNARREDTNAQNRLLHQQLEGVTAQISALQQNRLQTYDETEDVTGPVPDIDGLRELNSYLRREKEILEVQHDTRLQECKRLQQQLEYAQSQLDEARLKLDQERRSHAESGKNSLSHQDLMAKLNELNLYRESSATLRNELAQAKAQLTEKNAKISELEARIQPLESQIEALKTEKTFLQDELKQIQEDRDRWQKRTEDILTKYGRVDAAELEQLKETVTTLEGERDALKTAEEPLKAKITELETLVETERGNWQTTRQKLVEQFKDRSRKLTGEKNEAIQRGNELQAQLDAANEQLTVSKQQVTIVTTELDASKQEKFQLEKQILEFQHTVNSLREQAAANAQAPIETVAVGEQQQPTDGIIQELEQRLALVKEELDAVSSQKAEAEAELANLRSQLQTTIAERDQALEQARAGIEAVEGQPVAQPAAPGGELSAEERKAFEEKIQAAEAKVAEYEERAKEAESRIEQTIKQRSDKMRDALNNKLRTARAEMEEGFKAKEAEFEAQKAEWKTAEGELRLKLEQERIIKAAEGGPTAPAAPDAADGTQQVPATPTTPAMQPPSTPATKGTPAGDLTQLSDADLRKLLTTHATAKSIFANNIKKRLEVESAKLKTELEQTLKGEYEAKVAQAREQGQMMEQKKSTVKINMTENKFRAAQAKLGVVQTAAAETPQKPVGEVWEIALQAKPAPPAAAAATVQPGLGRQNSTAGVPPSPVTGTPGPSPAVNISTPSSAAGQRGPGSMVKPGAPQGQVSAPVLPSPFDASPANRPGGPNPFALPRPPTLPQAPPPQQQAPPQQRVQAQPQLPPAQQQQQAGAGAGAAQAGPVQKPQQQQQARPQQQQQQQQGRPSSLPQPPPQQQQQQRGQSGLPVPRGGHRGGRGGGPYVPPQRNASGGAAERGGGHARGRGGHGRGGLNPGASDFQPGSKRPRGDSEIGAGAKRARGSH
ncbi:Filament-forming protein [Scedosporium apiospermum]|uniref:Filament-forming protein n=1 Tax=Pseudallescheria apiosperma TaxID=563466 RepID=A0A084FY92_PSEDA|nr:Filament-forming protein [Scedosporium apiospermum]KEZ40054.1 Filament-forming protein [Scedosporium apiospermum]